MHLILELAYLWKLSVTWALMNRSISASSRWTSREISSSSIGSRSSGESPEEFPAPLPPPWRRSSRDSASPVDTADPVCRKSMDDIWEFSPSSSCSLGCLQPSPAAAVRSTASTTTKTAELLQNQRQLRRIPRGEEWVRGKKLTRCLHGLLREGGRRVEEGKRRRDLAIHRHRQRVPAHKLWHPARNFSMILTAY